jgi:hypothetical protein
MIVEFMDCGAKSSSGPPPVSIPAPKSRPQAPKTPAPRAKALKAKAQPAAQTAKAAKADPDTEPTDRLPTELVELKETKTGLVTFLFLSGKETADIAREL